MQSPHIESSNYIVQEPGCSYRIVESEQEGQQQSGDSSVLRDASGEGRITLDHQIQSIRNTESRAFQMLRLNIVIIGAILGAVPLGNQLNIPLDSFINLFSIIGTLAMFGSILSAAATHTITSLNAGIGSEGLLYVLDQEYEGPEFQETLTKGYANWLVYNQQKMLLQNGFFILCMALFIDSLVLLAAGLVVGLQGPELANSTLNIAFAACVIVLLLVDYALFRIDSLAAWVQSLRG